MKIPKHETGAAEDEEIIRMLTAFDPPIPPAAALERQPLPWLQGDRPMNPLQRLLARPALRLALSLALLAALVGGYAIFDSRTVSAREVLASAREHAGANPGLSYRGTIAGSGLGLDDAAITLAVQSHKVRTEICLPGAAACHVNIQTPRFTWTYDPALHIAELLETPTSAPRDDGVTGGLFGALSLESMLAAANEHAEVELEADATVAGRPAYVLTITPDETPDQRMRFWLDQEHFIVLRADALASDGVVLSNFGYTHLEFDPALDPSLFDFAPPAGTDVTCRRSLTIVEQQGSQVTIRRKIDPATGQVIEEDPEVPCPPFPAQP